MKYVSTYMKYVSTYESAIKQVMRMQRTTLNFTANVAIILTNPKMNLL